MIIRKKDKDCLADSSGDGLLLLSSSDSRLPVLTLGVLFTLFSLNINAAEPKEVEEQQKPMATVKVVGVGGDLYKNLELNIPTQRPLCTAEQEEIKRFIKSLKKRFRKSSRAVGYYDAQFSDNFRKLENCWQITMDIKGNRPIKVSRVNYVIKGEGRADFRELINKPPYRRGEVLNHKKYADGKSQLKDQSQALGYFDAAFEEHKIIVNPLKYTAEVDLVFNTGKRFRYGKINVDQKVLRDKTIQSFLQIKEGDLYDSDVLIEQQQLLQNSGYYADINIDAKHQQAENYRVPIDIKLTAKKRDAYKFKVGYGTDTGPRISGDLNRRWTGGRGQRLELNATASPILSNFTVKLIEPQTNPKDDVLSYILELKREKTDDIVSNSLKLGAEYTRRTENDWKQTASITYLKDKTQVEGEEPSKSELTLFGAKAEKVKADNLIFPTNGWRISGGARVAFKNLLSDQNVLQLMGSGKYIKKLGDGRFISRLDLGTTIEGDIDTLPKSLRFFAGGGQSVRGYSFESLGALNADNKVIGGKHLIAGSVEYEYPINEQWGAAVFVDAGNAFNDLGNPDLKLGAGIGARWKSPVGPVRIDIGFPQDRVDDPHLHLSIGSDL